MRAGRALAAALAVLAQGCAVHQWAAVPIIQSFRRPLLPTGLPHREVSFQTADGLTLRGWLFEPAGPPRGLVVFLHGKDDNRANGLEAAERFVPRGYTVLLYDQRAHGESDGAYTTYGFRERDDLRRAVDLVGADRVVAMGMSLGAAVVLQAAPEDPRIRAVVALASFSDLETIIRERAGPLVWDEALVAGAMDAAGRTAGFEVREISPARAAARIEVPTLIVHGLQDGFTTVDHGRRIYAALKCPKRLLLVDGAGHADLPTHDPVWDAVEAWVVESLSPGSASP